MVVLIDGRASPSRSPITQRREVMAEDLTQQLWKDVEHRECFSLQLDQASGMRPGCVFLFGWCLQM